MGAAFTRKVNENMSSNKCCLNVAMPKIDWWRPIARSNVSSSFKSRPATNALLLRAARDVPSNSKEAVRKELNRIRFSLSPVWTQWVCDVGVKQVSGVSTRIVWVLKSVPVCQPRRQLMYGYAPTWRAIAISYSTTNTPTSIKRL